MSVPHTQIEAVRGFSRFYTRQIGLLQEGLFESPFTLSEARVLHELAGRETTTASDIAVVLGLDPGYLSRILRKLERHGFVTKRPSSTDGRRVELSLTDEGCRTFAALNSASSRQVKAMLEPLSGADRERLVHGIREIESVLGAGAATRPSFILRTHQPGDMGWVVQRHGELYWMARGWDESFEGLVARLVSDFIAGYDPHRERCWIAEVDGARVGSVFCVRRSKTMAQLRMLIVEPTARGLGIGTRLVEECVRFARHSGYRKMILYTDRELHAAKRIYEATGFTYVRDEPHLDAGNDHVGEVWEMKL